MESWYLDYFGYKSPTKVPNPLRIQSFSAKNDIEGIEEEVEEGGGEEGEVRHWEGEGAGAGEGSHIKFKEWRWLERILDFFEICRLVLDQGVLNDDPRQLTWVAGVQEPDHWSIRRLMENKVAQDRNQKWCRATVLLRWRAHYVARKLCHTGLSTSAA